MPEEYENEEVVEETEEETVEESPEEPEVEEAAEDQPATLDYMPLIQELAERLAAVEAKMGDYAALLVDAGATVTETDPVPEEEEDEPVLLLEDMDFTI